MKNTFKILMLTLSVICINSAFIELPASLNNMVISDKNSMISPYGGAYLVFAGKYGGEIKKSEIGGQRELKVEGCAKGAVIFSYTLEITKNGTKTSMDATSNALSDEMVSKLQSLSPGDSFEFKSMKAHMPNDKDIFDVHGQKFLVV